jgi:hypothetical protein
LSEETLMSNQLTVEELIEAAKKLASDDRERLVRILTQQNTGGRQRITRLRGLGKEIWKGVDAQEYLNSERDSWET